MEKVEQDSSSLTPSIASNGDKIENKLNIWIKLFIVLVIIQILIGLRTFVNSFTASLGAYIPGGVYQIGIARGAIAVLLGITILLLIKNRRRLLKRVAVIHLTIQVLYYSLGIVTSLPYLILFVMPILVGDLDSDSIVLAMSVLMIFVNVVASIAYLLYFIRSKYISMTFSR